MKIKKGDRFLCIKTVVMEDDKEIAYKQGAIYSSQEDGCITDEQGTINHIWEEEEQKEFFRKLKSNNVNHPPHYTQGKIECIDALESAFGTEAVINFCACNAMKYIWRSNHKNGEEDINKCQWYLNKMLELKKKLNDKK